MKSTSTAKNIINGTNIETRSRRGNEFSLKINSLNMPAKNKNFKVRVIK